MDNRGSKLVTGGLYSPASQNLPVIIKEQRVDGSYNKSLNGSDEPGGLLLRCTLISNLKNYCEFQNSFSNYNLQQRCYSSVSTCVSNQDLSP